MANNDGKWIKRKFLEDGIINAAKLDSSLSTSVSTSASELALISSGTITIGEALTTGTAALGASFANAIVVATMASTTGVTGYVESAICDGAGLVTVTLDAAPGAGETTVVNYIADAR